MAIGEPPLLVGATQDTSTPVLVAAATTLVGAPGTVAVGVTGLGVTVVVAAEGADGPVPLVAVTVNVYETPLVKPVTVELRAVLGLVRPPHREQAGLGVIV